VKNEIYWTPFLCCGLGPLKLIKEQKSATSSLTRTVHWMPAVSLERIRPRASRTALPPPGSQARSHVLLRCRDPRVGTYVSSCESSVGERPTRNGLCGFSWSPRSRRAGEIRGVNGSLGSRRAVNLFSFSLLVEILLRGDQCFLKVTTTPCLHPAFRRNSVGKLSRWSLPVAYRLTLRSW